MTYCHLFIKSCKQTSQAKSELYRSRDTKKTKNFGVTITPASQLCRFFGETGLYNLTCD